MAVKVDRQKCTGCGVCVDICPVSAIEVKADNAVISDECIECRVCINQCPNEAISLPELGGH